MDTRDPKFDAQQPKFTPSHKPDPSGERDGLVIVASGMTPASVPGQRIIGTKRDPDTPGYSVQISVPHLPYERWIDDAGNVCSCPVRTNRVMSKSGKGSSDDGNYQSQMTNRAFLSAGWVRYDDGLGFRPSVKFPQWSQEARQALIDERQKDQRDRTKAQEMDFLDKSKKEANDIQRALTDALNSFAEGNKDRATRAAKRAELDK